MNNDFIECKVESSFDKESTFSAKFGYRLVKDDDHFILEIKKISKNLNFESKIEESIFKQRVTIFGTQ